MPSTKYKVTGQHAFLGHRPGVTFSGPLPTDILEAELLESGAVSIVTDEDSSDAAAEKIPCPACVEQELSRPPKFDDLEKLQRHYEERHAGLAVPDSMPAPAEQEA